MYICAVCGTSVSSCSFFQGVLGIKVKIMLPWDPNGKMGPKKPLPDHVSIVEPKEEVLPASPFSEAKLQKPADPAATAAAAGGPPAGVPT